MRLNLGAIVENDEQSVISRVDGWREDWVLNSNKSLSQWKVLRRETAWRKKLSQCLLDLAFNAQPRPPEGSFKNMILLYDIFSPAVWCTKTNQLPVGSEQVITFIIRLNLIP